MGKTKKFLTCIFSICACVVMVASLAACGKGSSKQYKTVKEYLNAEEVQNEIKEQIDLYNADGIKLELTADDNTLTYKYTYNMNLEPSDELTAAFDEQIDQDVKDQMDEMIKELSKLIDAKDISIIFRYYSADGTELYSCEFK